jgi:hypothetical protein
MPEFRVREDFLQELPASTSTTTPSRQWQSVTKTLFSEPSGFTVKDAAAAQIQNDETARAVVLAPVARSVLRVLFFVSELVLILVVGLDLRSAGGLGSIGRSFDSASS